MLNHKKLKNQKGFNLVELMVGLAVGLLVSLAMSSVYLNNLRGSKDAIRANRLNQEMRAAMDIMVADIRRAGYWGNAASSKNNPFSRRSTPSTDIYVSTNCILYSYDATYPGGDSNFFGFRQSNNAVQILVSATLNDTSTNCNDTTWADLTDTNSIIVTSLVFDTSGSRCLAYDSFNYNPNDSSTASYAAHWAVASGGTTAACETTPPSGVIIPATADTRVEMRQINITLTARHASDSSLVRTLSESILVRNNRIILN